ncbi:L,D-transpeptidase family protein [Sphingoaurantiacus capsulatus]
MRRPGLLWSLAGVLLSTIAATPVGATAAEPAATRATAAAFETALRAAVSGDGDLQKFYLGRNWRPLWMDGGKPSADAKSFADRLKNAADDGLSPDRYGAPAIEAALTAAESGDGPAMARAEALLSRAYGGYLADLHRPADGVKMAYVHDGLAPEKHAPGQWLWNAGKADTLSKHIASSTRMNPVYEELRAAYADYRDTWSDLPTTRVAPGPMLRAGATGARVASLRERLGLPASPATFDESVAAKLRAFQSAHGLPVDGAAGPKTVAALNEGPGRFERLIRANLERARAIPADPGRRFLVVDTAGATLRAYEDGKVAEQMHVIVGKPDMPTPAMAGRISHAVLNPYWNLPPDLAQIRAERVLAMGKKYLVQDRLEAMSSWEADARVLSPDEVDWKAVASGKQQLRMRQTPGPHNMMGKIKFMLPNRYGIYLHDTPEKLLFANDQRRFSSGCVRLADAPRLARFLFDGKAPDPDKAGAEERVDLPKGVPVYITYLTVEPKAGGGLAFRADPYKRDGTLMASLSSSGGGQTAQGLK